MLNRSITRRYCTVLVGLLTLGGFQAVNADPQPDVLIRLETPQANNARPRGPAHKVLVTDVSGHIQVGTSHTLSRRAWRALLDKRFRRLGRKIGLDQPPLPLQLKMRSLYPPTRPLPSGPEESKAPAIAPTPRAGPAGPSSPR
ncbi:MAG: hypothetical protein QGH11_06545 [Pirellulaceae bacterium]|nr:hypothetical protein [Pirellulaceae bacterium]